MLRELFSTSDGRAVREARRMVQGPVCVRTDWARELSVAVADGDRPALRAIRFGWGSAVSAMEVENGVGVIQIRGPLVQGTYWTDYSDISAALDELAGQSAVHSILLDIDSPGGDVHGALFDLAEQIRAVRAEKPVWALADGQAASAAYVIAAQAQKVYGVNANTAVVGSLGVIAVHTDWSGYNERAGLKITEVVTGRHKADLSRDRPLSKDGRATLQMLVDGAFAEVIAATTAGRRALTEDAIRDMEAAIYLAGAGQEVGLVDGIASREDLVEKLAEKSRNRPFGLAPRGSTEDPMAEETTTTTDAPADPTPTPETPAQPADAGEAPAAGAEVIDLEAQRRLRGEGRAEAHAEAVAIVEACALGGVPALAAELLKESGMTLEAARARIQDARVRASSEEIQSATDPLSARARNPLHDAIEAMVASKDRGARKDATR